MIGIHTGKKTFSLCVVAVLTAPLVTFSQDAGKTNSLPIDREITDESGKNFQGPVMEINRAIPQDTGKPAPAEVTSAKGNLPVIRIIAETKCRTMEKSEAPNI